MSQSNQPNAQIGPTNFEPIWTQIKTNLKPAHGLIFKVLLTINKNHKIEPSWFL